MEVAALLEGCTAPQREAITSPGAPLCILAAPGSGKTRVLTRRIAWRVATGDADPRHVLAVTFTRRAAGEMAARLAALGVRDQVTAGTFHALALATLRRRWADRRERPPVLLERPARLVARVLDGGGRAPVAAVAAEIEWAKSRLVAPAAYEARAAAAGRRPPLAPAVLATCYERYELEKRRRGLVDFADLLLRCARLLEHDEEAAAVERWRFRHLFVDEVQDANPLQWRLLRAWLGDRTDLCVVGDPDQAIYAWNGADPRQLLALAADPATTVVRLQDTFRATPQLVAAGRAVGGAGVGLARPHRPDGPAPTLTAHRDDRDEARGVARRLRDRHAAGVPWSSMAVLVRTRALAAELADALRAAGIPCRTRAEAFTELPAVRDALDDLRRASGLPVSQLVVDLAAAAAAAADSAAAGGGPAPLDELTRLARLYASLDPSGGVEGFTTWLAATTRDDGPAEGGAAVDVITFHAAKGLEWPVVVLAGLEDGLVPVAGAASREARAEERRLLYVAVTRAERELHCSWARRRRGPGGAAARRPSPWLTDLAAVCGGREPAPDWRRALAENRARLDVTDHDPVLAELTAWRARTARAAGVAPSAVVADRALAALARTRPTDDAALARVPGLGPVGRARYGSQLLAAVAGAVGGRPVDALPPVTGGSADGAGSAGGAERGRTGGGGRRPSASRRPPARAH